MAQTMREKPLDRSSTDSWPEAIRREYEARQFNGSVGTKLLSEDERVRVWEIRLASGERVGFHRHVLDYFWTAVTAGCARSHQQDGTTVETTYEAGETRHETYGPGEFKVHDLENIGDSELIFTTVEFLQSANQPLPLSRMVEPANQFSKNNER